MLQCLTCTVSLQVQRLQANLLQCLTCTVPVQVQRLQEDVSHLEGEKHEHESTIIEQQDHMEKLQDNCRELQEAAQAVQQDSDVKYAASIAQMKQERKQQVCSTRFLWSDEALCFKL